MNAFFASPHHRSKLCLESAKWIGTPFAPHAAIRGAGVDCVNLVGQLLIACGHATNFELPKYVMDGGKHNATSQLTDYLDSHPEFARINPDSAAPQLAVNKITLAEPGDVLCFILGRSSHHCGQLIHGKTFVHALYGRKVAFASLADKTFARALAAIYRPLKMS